MTSVAVLTPQPGFGHLLYEALADLGAEVTVYPRLEAIPPEAAPALLVVDGSIAPSSVLVGWLARQRARQPAPRVLYLPTQTPKEEIPADAVVEPPFYLPDFVAAAERLLQQVPSPPRPPWLRDVDLAAQHLARLSMEAAAQAAALVTPEGRLWAYAGELPQPAAEELAHLAARHWDWQGKDRKDIARFLRLEALQQDLLLYATAVTDDLVLAMAFDVQTPFSRIRAQATRLAEALTSEPLPDLPETPSPQPFSPDALPPAAEASPAEDALPPTTPEETPAAASAADDDLPPEASEPLFDEVPPPEPPTSPRASVTSQVSVQAQPVVNTSSPPTPQDPAHATALLPPSPTPARSTVYYAFVLLPRFPQHTLSGDLARDLSRWMPQIALAFGWRLLHLAVRPAYIQWIVQAPPETSPAEVLRTVRRRTSERVFAAYPRLAETNPSGQFWAPGYLLLSQNQPIPEKTIHAFIAATRRHQGLAGGE